jgi:putative ABC transport system permease protein
MAFEPLLQDLRIGARVLVRERAFAALAIFVLAVGIAAVTTQFSVVNGVLLRGFSFPHASRLMHVNFIDPSTATAFGVSGRILSMDFEELREAQQSFERMAAYLSGSTVNVTVNGAARRYTGAYVTEDFLRGLGIAPVMGRHFAAEDNRPGAPKVALIGHGLWQRDFGGAPDIVGRPVRINGAAATIIGVMPQGFTFPVNEEVWIPLYGEFPVRARNDPRANSPAVFGLLRADRSVAQAEAEITGFARRFAEAYPETNARFDTGLVEPLINRFTPVSLRGTLLTMLAFCAGVLLIACVNVMNMQFARATQRLRELAVRSSLGATRVRLLRQMLTESLLLAGAGALLGIGLARLSVGWLSATVRSMDNPPPAWMTFDIDVRVLAFTVSAMMGAAVVSGLLPAWMASRVSAIAVLKEGGRGTTGRVGLVTRGLVVVQIVVTCVLLIGALLQLKSLVQQQAIDYGYDTAGLLSARMGLMEADYPTPEARKLFYDRLLRDLPESPEFAGVALTSRLRMVFAGNAPIEIEGVAYADRQDRPNTNLEQVSPGFFGLMGMHLLEGRAFSPEDLDQGRPVAIVNTAFAQKHFRTGSALGRRFRTGDGSAPPGPWLTIVGVVNTVRMLGPFNNPNVDASGFYLPFYSAPFGPPAEAPFANQFATVLVRPRPGQRPEALANTLRRAVNTLDPHLPLYYVGTPRQHLDGAIAGSRIIATMFLVFGGIAIVLAGVGIYGVMSFSVSRRTQEFGVRMALGADQARILRMVLAQGSWQVGLGLVLGLGLALVLATVGRAAIAGTLYEVSPRDPLIYGAVVVLVTLVSLAAVLVPGRRAARVDPLVALRVD